MESDTAGPLPAEQLRELGRQQVSVYMAQRNPGWAWPVFGAASGLYIVSFAVPNQAVHVVAALGWALLVGIWAGVVVRRTGVQPRLRGMPRPLLRELWRFWAIGAAAALAVVGVGLSVSWLLAGALAAAACVVGGERYERRYRRVARAVAAGSSRA